MADLGDVSAYGYVPSIEDIMTLHVGKLRLLCELLLLESSGPKGVLQTTLIEYFHPHELSRVPVGSDEGGESSQRQVGRKRPRRAKGKVGGTRDRSPDYGLSDAMRAFRIQERARMCEGGRLCTAHRMQV